MASVLPSAAIEHLLIRPEGGGFEPAPRESSKLAAGPGGVPLAVLLGPFQAGQEDELHAQIRAARRGGPAAVEALLAGVAGAAPGAWPDLGSALVYAVPGHLPGGSSPLVEAAAATIAASRGWELHLQALMRLRPSPEGKLGSERIPALESLTLSVVATGSARGDRPEAIVLVDDVVRSGASLLACADAVRRSGDAGLIVAIVIGRADPATKTSSSTDSSPCDLQLPVTRSEAYTRGSKIDI